MTALHRADAVGVAGPLAAGVDIGGSKVLAVLLDSRREVVAQARLRTNVGLTGVVDSATDALREVAAMAGLDVGDLPVVGVGVPGLVTPGTGDVTHAVNLGVGARPLRLAPQLADRLGVPVVVENDVNAAALGAAQVMQLDTSDLAFLSIGTGLAAGLVTGGRVRRGARGTAGEIGHVPVDPAGPPCTCGQRGCLETLASGSAIAVAWPGTGQRPPAAELFAAAGEGDAAAVAVRDRFADAVAAAVRLLVLTCDVETVVLGGGVTEVGSALLDAVRAGLRRQAEVSPFLDALELPSRVTIVPPGSAVAAVGAALAGLAGLEEAARPRLGAVETA